MTESFKYEVLDVSLVSGSESESLLAFSIDYPSKGTEADSTVMDVGGWVLGKTSPAMAVELIRGDSVFRSIPLNYPRPDVAKRYSKGPSAIKCGFQMSIDISGLSTEEELLFQAVFPDENPVPMATLKLWHNGKIPRTEAHRELVTSLGEGQLPSKLEQIKIDLERSRTFLQRVQSELG
ncbi:hypothetical protein M595_6048 [Lyngbya aestuarii BL J]|uniref:Uncharacterized protein n=1 Tax=Lyngbya aestuarii BL J TaxID=1348334 RepID=U7Q859_9CYAN|nr:hypothetical protein [Lyngbya aestuarii]ERT04014.1 hypothetical protein M595_6048 [Lyngbya aestuarii BL J]